MYLPPACHTLSKSEKISFCGCLRGVKVPQGYSSNFKSLVSMEELRHEIRRELEELSQQHTPLQEGVVLPTRGKASTKGSCATEDEEEEDTLVVDTSYRCKLFAGDPPRLVAIGSVFATSSTLHTVPLGDDFSRVVVEEVREADVEVPVPTSEVRLVGEALGTFIAWPSRLL